jgi:hypothetical protein
VDSSGIIRRQLLCVLCARLEIILCLLLRAHFLLFLSLQFGAEAMEHLGMNLFPGV